MESKSRFQSFIGVFFKRDSMFDILSIMRFCYNNNGKKVCTENNLKQNFGLETYEKFSLFCIGGPDPYAQEVPEKVDDKHISVIKLTQSGIRKYFELNKEAKRDDLQAHTSMMNLLYTGINVLLLCLTIYVSINVGLLSASISLQQTSIQSKQLELINVSTIPNGASMYFWTSKNVYEFSKHDLNQSAAGMEYTPIYMCLANKGRIASGVINGITDDKNFVLSPHYYITGISPGEYNCSNNVVIPLNCESLDICPPSGNCLKTCDYEKMPTGLYELNITFTCLGPCIENEWNETIKLCIWENSSTECVKI